MTSDLLKARKKLEEHREKEHHRNVKEAARKQRIEELIEAAKKRKEEREPPSVSQKLSDLVAGEETIYAEGYFTTAGGTPSAGRVSQWNGLSIPVPNTLSGEKKVEDGSPAFLALLEELRDLHLKKSAGYAGIGNPDPWANFRECERLGINVLDGLDTRMSDKWVRFCNIRRDNANEQVGEALRDTLLDLASYALIRICLMEE